MPLSRYGLPIGLAVGVALLVRVFIVEAYRIPSSAMSPVLEAGDTIFVSKVSYGFGNRAIRTALQRGDIVVFSPPQDPTHDYIKRVVGLPGDTVTVRAGRVLIGQTSDASVDTALKPLPEGAGNCAPEFTNTARGPVVYTICFEPPILENFGPEKLSEDQIFLLGDLRKALPKDISKPRSFGTMPLESIRGKAVLTWLSIEPSEGQPAFAFPKIRFERMFQSLAPKPPGGHP